MNLTAGLREGARRHPDAPAVIVGQPIDGVDAHHVYTYEAFDRIVDAVALRSNAWGLRPDDHVSLTLRAHFPLLALRLGFARAGIATGSANIASTASARIAMHADDASGGRPFVVDPSWWSVPARGEVAPMHPGGDALFTIQATSGTTGEPKAVPVSHAQFGARMRTSSAFAQPEDVRMLCTSGPGGGFGLQHALRALDAGGTVVVAAISDDVPGLIARHRINKLVSSPYAVAQLIDRLPAEAPRPASLEQVLLSGAHLPTALGRRAIERLCDDVLCLYGSTEAGAVACGYARDMRGIDGATGFLFAGAAVEALDDAGRPLPRGAIGPLRLRAPGMSTSYLGDAEATARMFRDGWCHPGDIGTVTEDGILVITGRDDDLINVGGSKVAPESIEHVLSLVPGVTDAVAFGVPDGFGTQVIHAAIVCTGDIDTTMIERAFRAYAGVPPPSVVLRVPKLPRDEAGKVRRDALVRYVRSLPGRQSP